MHQNASHILFMGVAGGSLEKSRRSTQQPLCQSVGSRPMAGAPSSASNPSARPSHLPGADNQDQVWYLRHLVDESDNCDADSQFCAVWYEQYGWAAGAQIGSWHAVIAASQDSGQRREQLDLI